MSAPVLISRASGRGGADCTTTATRLVGQYCRRHDNRNISGRSARRVQSLIQSVRAATGDRRRCAPCGSIRSRGPERQSGLAHRIRCAPPAGVPCAAGLSRAVSCWRCCGGGLATCPAVLCALHLAVLCARAPCARGGRSEFSATAAGIVCSLRACCVLCSQGPRAAHRWARVPHFTLIPRSRV